MFTHGPTQPRRTMSKVRPSPESLRSLTRQPVDIKVGAKSVACTSVTGSLNVTRAIADASGPNVARSPSVMGSTNACSTVGAKI